MKKREKNTERIPLSLKICEKFDLPADTLTSLSIEIVGNREAVIRGCRSILVYTNELIRLETKEKDIVIEGEKLCCPAYGGGSIVISGHFRCISYEEKMSNGNIG